MSGFDQGLTRVIAAECVSAVRGKGNGGERLDPFDVV